MIIFCIDGLSSLKNKSSDFCNYLMILPRIATISVINFSQKNIFVKGFYNYSKCKKKVVIARVLARSNHSVRNDIYILTYLCRLL